MEYDKEISFGAFDSELMHQEIFIPEGFEATIEGDRIILTRIDEDEKIVNAIRKALESKIEDLGNGVTRTACLAWLEKQETSYTKRDVDNAYVEGMAFAKDELDKQGEQKLPIEKLPSEMKTIGESLEFTTQEECDEYNQIVSDLIMSDNDNIEPKFKVGDWVFIEEVKGYKNGPFQIKTVDSFGYSFDEYHTIPFMYEDLLSKWTIQNAKPGDILFQDLMDGKTFIYNGINPEMAILYSFIISNDGEDVLPYHIGKPNTGIGNIEDNKNIIHPATKEQCDLLFQKIKEAGYEWDSETKKLKKIEQNLVDKIEPKFKVGDWIISNNKKSTYQVIEVKRGIYVIRDNADNYEYHIGIEECEKSGRLFTIYDAKDGDVLACPLPKSYETKEQIFIFKGINNRDYVDNCIEYYCHICDDVFYVNENYFMYMGTTSTSVYPATKEQRDLLFQKMKEAGYEWDSEKKELKKIKKNTDVNHEYFSDLLEKDDSDNIDDYAYQCAYCMSHDWIEETATWEDVQKAVKLGAEWKEKQLNNSLTDWSKEDEQIKEDIIYDLNILLKGSKSEWTIKDLSEWTIKDIKKEINWLQSLRPKNQWKPSDEQMEALYEETQKSDRIRDNRIVSLYNDLKKLKGE